MTYDTLCECGAENVIRMKITEDMKDQTCTECGEKKLKVQHKTTNRVILKGSGWFGQGRG